MIRALREIDRLYLGPRVGRGSAFNALVMLCAGFMPLAFVLRYLNGELDHELARIRAA